MYLSVENKKKLILASIVIGLSTLTLIAGKTLANTLILTSYPIKVLPYFYFFVAISTILVTVVSGHFQQTNSKKFAFFFKFIFLSLILIFIAAIHWGGPIIPFIISILVLSFTGVISVIAWSYLSDIYDIQEFKRFSKVFQSCSTIGAILSGVLVGAVSTQFNPTRLLVMIFVVEVVSLFFIIPLARYISGVKPSNKTPLKLSSTMKQNSIFKYFAFLSVAAVVSTTLIDYNLKLELVKSIDKQNLAFVISSIFVISTTGILIIQLFFIDYLLRLIGSKKIVIIFPIVILITSLIALVHYNLIIMAILFIVNEILTYTTFFLSRNLYLNILPQSVKNLSRMKLKGTISSLAIILASALVYGLSHLQNKITPSLVLIIVCSCVSIYLAIILIKIYRIQLVQSLYLRRFNSELINMTEVDKKDAEELLKQALDSPNPDANLFGLQLLMRDKSLTLTPSLIPLLMGDNKKIVREIAKLLANHSKNKLFFEAAKSAFWKSTDSVTRWYLLRYLIETDKESLIDWVSELLKTKTASSLAFICLIYLKQGDLDQQLLAIKSLLTMHHSEDIEQKKWFLYALKETSVFQKDKYLTQYIDQKNTVLQSLALQQIGMKPSGPILDLLVAHLGEPNTATILGNCIIDIGEPIVERVEQKIRCSPSYPTKISCIRTLSLVGGIAAEISLMNVLKNSHDVVMNTAIAKYIAYRGIKLKISDQLCNFLIDTIKSEVDVYFLLLGKLEYYGNLSIRDEITSRLQFIKIRVLYYSAAVIGSMDILNSVSLLTLFHPDKNQQAIALELIDATAENREISSLLLTLFVETKVKVDSSAQPINDPWLTQFIRDVESNNMDSIYTLTKLRKVTLFKDFAAETLQVLVQCCFMRDMAKDEVIFKEGDIGDKLYIVDSGEVAITKNGVHITTLGEGAYFGELALLSDTPRFATVTAISEGALFYIDRQDFDRITDEVPEIMKSINKQVIKYIITNASLMRSEK